MKKIILSSLFLIASTLLVSAQTLDPDTVLQKIVTEIFSPLYQAVTAIAFVYFLYGGVKFIFDLNHPEEKNTGKQHLLWGSVGLLIIFSVGGILSIFTDIFGSLGVS